MATKPNGGNLFRKIRTIRTYSTWWILNSKEAPRTKYLKTSCTKFAPITRFSKTKSNRTSRKNSSKWLNKHPTNNLSKSYPIFQNTLLRKISSANIFTSISCKKLSQRTKTNSLVPKKHWRNKRNWSSKSSSSWKTT